MKDRKPVQRDNSTEQDNFNIEIEDLKKELQLVQQETAAFEAILRSHLVNEIVEEQELSVLYKKLKQAKKEKRQEQARRGKNYRDPIGLKAVAPVKNNIATREEQQEMKRLYREAMLYSHPDKFSLAEEKTNLATEVTVRLIEIYKSGNFEELRGYHHHILSGNAIAGIKAANAEELKLPEKDQYQEKELAKLKTLLAEAKERFTYKVLKEYKDPLTFIEELKEYYEDRLKKLRKRTRKK